MCHSTVIREVTAAGNVTTPLLMLYTQPFAPGSSCVESHLGDNRGESHKQIKQQHVQGQIVPGQ